MWKNTQSEGLVKGIKKGGVQELRWGGAVAHMLARVKVESNLHRKKGGRRFRGLPTKKDVKGAKTDGGKGDGGRARTGFARNGDRKWGGPLKKRTKKVKEKIKKTKKRREGE